LRTALPDYRPTVHTSVVHDTSEDWPPLPGDPTRLQPAPATSFLSDHGFDWAARESINTLPVLQHPDYRVNLKARALSRHVSQDITGARRYMTGWIVKDEVFWVEDPSGSNTPPHVEAGPDQVVSGGSSVRLDGSASFDPDGTGPDGTGVVEFEWYQVAGPPVTLVNPNSGSPTFTSPNSTASAQILVFELIVHDASTTSIPDSVIVIVSSSATGERPGGPTNGDAGTGRASSGAPSQAG